MKDATYRTVIMAENACPRLVRILVWLANDCWSKYANRHWVLHDRRQTLGYEAYEALDEQHHLKRRIRATEAKIEAHPLRSFVSLVSQETGLNRDELESAARREFNG